MESTVENGGTPESDNTPTVAETENGAEKSTFEVSFAPSKSTGAPPETSAAMAVPVKPYTPVSAAESSAVKMSSVLESDRRGLLDDESSSDDSDYDAPISRSNAAGQYNTTSKWWFQQPAIKKNWCLVVGIWILFFIGIALFVAGIVLEILHHHHTDEIIRGFIFFVISVLVLIPTVYAALHVYLAAKRVGRVRFSSVWFFR